MRFLSRKLLSSLLLVTLISSPCFAYTKWGGGPWSSGKWGSSITGYDNRGVQTSSRVENIKRIIRSNLTFAVDYEGRSAGDSINTNYSVGSATGTFTRTAGDTSTYIDSDGKIKLSAPNTPRFTKFYFDESGIHLKSGLMMERASTNLLQDSYFADGSTTYWIANGTATVTNDATYTNKYLGGKCQKVVSAAQYDGVITAVAKRPTFTATKVSTVSAIVQGTGTAMAYYKNVGGATQYGTPVTLAGATVPIKISQSFTADATAAGDIGIVSNDGTSTFYVHIIQCEGAAASQPYSTSFIPTTTAALGRNAEALSYVGTGNRTSATESIFIKFAFESTGAIDTLLRVLTATPTASGQRRILKTNTKATIDVEPNGNTPSVPVVTTTTTPQANTSYVIAATMAATGNPNNTIYLNGSAEATSNDDWTAQALDPFYVGCNSTAGRESDGIIQAVAIAKDVEGQSNVTAIDQIMKQAA